jgi:hypothetical protein
VKNWDDHTYTYTYTWGVCVCFVSVCEMCVCLLCIIRLVARDSRARHVLTSRDQLPAMRALVLSHLRNTVDVRFICPHSGGG